MRSANAAFVVLAVTPLTVTWRFPPRFRLDTEVAPETLRLESVDGPETATFARDVRPVAVRFETWTGCVVRISDA
jgi:hypothetical protein